MTDPKKSEEKRIIEHETPQKGMLNHEFFEGKSTPTLTQQATTKKDAINKSNEHQKDDFLPNHERKVLILEKNDLGALKEEIPPNLRPNIDFKVHHIKQRSKHERATSEE